MFLAIVGALIAGDYSGVGKDSFDENV